MKINTREIKPFVLPAAIVLGLFFHDLCEAVSAIVPAVIFAILILAFSSTDLRKLKFERLDIYLMLFQIVATFAIFYLTLTLTANRTLAEGLMLGALCPVASSVTVVAVMIGAKRENTVAYTIYGNLLICLLAPLFFVIIEGDRGITFADSFISIFSRIAAAIGLPYFVMLAVQTWLKPVARTLRRINGLSFYLWALALLLTIGQTIDFIFLHGRGHEGVIIALAIGAFIICPLQFFIGRLLGKQCGDSIAGQQLLGQKNSAMGIWMSNTYLNPLASTFLAFYSISQNLLNSIQIWHHDRLNKRACTVGK